MAKRSKQILSMAFDIDYLQYSFYLFNGTVKPGDLITIKTSRPDKVIVLVDFEFDLDMSECDAIQNV